MGTFNLQTHLIIYLALFQSWVFLPWVFWEFGYFGQAYFGLEYFEKLCILALGILGLWVLWVFGYSGFGYFGVEPHIYYSSPAKNTRDNFPVHFGGLDVHPRHLTGEDLRKLSPDAEMISAQCQIVCRLIFYSSSNAVGALFSESSVKNSKT